ncbi:MAG: MarR family winged helix-turn-helix transcriptional regulator [Azospirillaceae bacterium]
MTEPLPSDVAITAWARLVRQGQRVLALVEGDLKAAGFPPLAWYDALLELRRVGDKGLRPYRLQREMLLAQYNMSRLLDRLVRAGHVERLPSAEDGRGTLMRISASGRELLDRMWPVYRAAIDRHFASRLSETEAATLSRLLARLGDG